METETGSSSGPEAVPPAGARADRSLPSPFVRLLRGTAWTAAAGILSLGVAVWNLRLWDADLRVPLFGFGSDASLTTGIIKGLVDHTWIWVDPDLGAPAGTQFFDYPAAFGDTLSIAVMKLMGLVSDDPILVVNAFFLLGFPLAAISAFWVLRSLGIGGWVALASAVLFAVLPGHFTRGIAHLGLATYWAVPLGAWLVLGAAGLHPLFARRDGSGGVLSWASRRTAATVVLVLFLGLSGLYYALFAVMLLVLVGLVYFPAKRRSAVLAQALVAAALLFGVVAAQQLPALVYSWENGRNDAVAARTPGESEIYGLKLTQVLLPSANHRFEPFASIGREYASATSGGEAFNAYLGTLLGLALVVAIVWTLSAAAGGGPRAGPEKALILTSGVVSTIIVLLSTVGGGGAILAFLLTSQIRAWNRISVYLGFFAVLVLAVLLTLAGRWLAARRVPTAVCGVGLAVVAVLGVLDQTTSPKVDFVGIREAWRSNVRFVREIDRRLPPGASILELPYVPFPENSPVGNMADYDLLAPYLADRGGLKWSYGAIKGRPDDWADDLSRRPVRQLVYGAAAAGFSGIYLDRDGYADDGRRVIRQIRAVAGRENEIESSDGRAVFFDLTALQKQIAAALPAGQLAAISDAVLKPVSVSVGPGFSPFEGTGVARRAWGDRHGELTVENPGSQPVKASLTMELAGPSDTVATRIVARCPGAPTRAVRVTSVRPGRLTVRLTVPAGGVSCAFDAAGPAGPVTDDDPRPKYQLVIGPQARTEGLSALAALARSGP